ncbi:MAG: YlxR family protein [Actinobacteria bacterium]|nr:YlxR family protein [Actinomycetota bacterium]MBV8958363.1 YlxR family protein [Actinomycetota bacterium]MBV9256118.1 YlxR family protein [Actinomycetota bacterium]MBV9665724.1 YlxR family protein [Actinomycetota bacterium]MBV9936800.1 YlxR family protein [Actinomycetota bacterium]
MAPARTCIGCRRKAPADELERVVRTAEGGLALGRHLPGRGAWLCAGSVACIDLAVRRDAFSRALRGEVHRDAGVSLRRTVAERARMEGRAACGVRED